MHAANLEKTPGYHGPYLERGGVNSRSIVEELAAPPEFPLDKQELEQAYAFEHALFAHEISDSKTIKDIIRAYKGEETIAPRFFAKAFLAGEVQSDVDMPPFTSPEAVYTWLTDQAEGKKMTPKTLRSLAKQSRDAYKEVVAQALVAEESVDPSWFEAQSVVIEPERFIETTHDMIKTREYLLALRKEYHEGTGDHLEGAKKALIDIYTARVNASVVESIPTAALLHRQALTLGDVEMAEAAKQVIPKGFQNGALQDSYPDAIYRRLDFVRNGIGFDANGNPSRVSHEVERAVELIEDGEKQEPVKAFFSEEETRILKNTMIEPKKMIGIMSAIIDRAGLLSQSDEVWSPTRVRRAVDNLFQVVENPVASSFAVDGKTGANKVPSSPRSLYDVITVGCLHELRHIDQAQADNMIGEKLHIATVKGRRLAMLRESDANRRQRMGEKALFGKAKPAALTYAKALRVLENNGSTMAATKAFYDEKRQIMPDVSPVAAASEAADRVLRLTRSWGIASGSMSYAEGVLLEAELQDEPDNVRERANMITTFDLVDQSRLHRYGLLNTDTIATSIDWTPHIMDVIMPYVEEALANAKTKQLPRK